MNRLIKTIATGLVTAAALTACGTSHTTTPTSTVKAGTQPTTPATAPAKPHRVSTTTPDGFAQNFAGQTLSAATVTNVKTYVDTTLPVTATAKRLAEQNVGHLVLASNIVNVAGETVTSVKVAPITDFASTESTNGEQTLAFTATFTLTTAQGKHPTGHRHYTLVVTPTANTAIGGYLVTNYSVTDVVWE